MKKIAALSLFFLIFAVGLAGRNSALAEDTSSGQSAPKTPDEYTVKKGDTLWDISKQFLHDPFKWPAIWNFNEFIANPDLIHPGEKLKFYPAIKEAAPPPEKVVEEKKEPVQSPQKAAIPAPPPPPKEYKLVPSESNPDVFMGAGFIDEKDSQVGYIATSFQEKSSFTDGDKVGLKLNGYDPKIGEKLVVYSTLKEVIHPKTGEKLGNLVKILGHLNVLQKKGALYIAEVTKVFDIIAVGGKIRKYEEMPIPLKDSGETPAEKTIDGYVVATVDNKEYTGAFSYTYIDRGRVHGVRPGDLFEIYREAPALRKADWTMEKDESIPPLEEKIGEFQILVVRASTATGWVINSSREIMVGEMVRYARKKEK